MLDEYFHLPLVCITLLTMSSQFLIPLLNLSKVVSGCIPSQLRDAPDTNSPVNQTPSVRLASLICIFFLIRQTQTAAMFYMTLAHPHEPSYHQLLMLTSPRRNDINLLGRHFNARGFTFSQPSGKSNLLVLARDRSRH